MQNLGMDRTRPPLRWMVLQARALGLRTKPFERELSSDEMITVIESLTLGWWPLEFYPWYRLTYTRQCDNGKKTTRKQVFSNCEERPQLTFFRPHLGSSRKIHANQKIHGSLLLADKLKSDYTPKARPLDDDLLFWDTARREGLGDWLELDLYDLVRAHVEKFITKDDSTVWQILRQTATWGKLAQYLRIFRSSHTASFSGWTTSSLR